MFLFQIILQIKVRGSIQRNRGGWGGVFAEKNLISMGSYIHCQFNHYQRVQNLTSVIVYSIWGTSNTVIKCEPNFSQIEFFILGEAYSATGKNAEAEKWYKESLKSKPDHLSVHLTYAKHLAKMVSAMLNVQSTKPCPLQAV